MGPYREPGNLGGRKPNQNSQLLRRARGWDFEFEAFCLAKGFLHTPEAERIAQLHFVLSQSSGNCHLETH